MKIKPSTAPAVVLLKYIKYGNNCKEKSIRKGNSK